MCVCIHIFIYIYFRALLSGCPEPRGDLDRERGRRLKSHLTAHDEQKVNQRHQLALIRSTDCQPRKQFAMEQEVPFPPSLPTKNGGEYKTSTMHQ